MRVCAAGHIIDTPVMTQRSPLVRPNLTALLPLSLAGTRQWALQAGSTIGKLGCW
jgi:hypothetical protein